MTISQEPSGAHAVTMLYLYHVLDGNWIQRRRLEDAYPNLSVGIAEVGLRVVDHIALPAVQQNPDTHREKRILYSREIFTTRASVPPRLFYRLQTRMLAHLVLRLISTERGAIGFSRKEERLFDKVQRAQKLRDLAGRWC